MPAAPSLTWLDDDVGCWLVAGCQRVDMRLAAREHCYVTMLCSLVALACLLHTIDAKSQSKSITCNK